MTTALSALAPFFAIIVAAITAFVAYMYQRSLKAFELHLGRREKALASAQELIDNLNAAILSPTDKTLDIFRKTAYHRHNSVYRQLKGCEFGEAVQADLNDYDENIEDLLSIDCWDNERVIEHVYILLNDLADIYGIANSLMTQELRHLYLEPNNILANIKRFLNGE